MLRRLLMASAGAVALAGSVAAADLPPLAPPAPIFTWTGVYMGGQAGYAWGRQTGTVFSPVGAATFSYNPQGVIGGAHVGYNYQINQWVLGIEGSVDGTSVSAVFVPGPGVTYTARSDVQGSIRGRVGIAWDRALLYATGGAAFGGFNTSFATPVGFASFSATRVGWTVGGGIAYAITNNWSVFGEYRYSDFGKYSVFPAVSFDGAGVSVQNHFTQNQVQVGFSYKFDMFAPPPVVAKY